MLSLGFFFSKMSKTKNKNTFISQKSKSKRHQPEIHKKTKKIESIIPNIVLSLKITESFSEKI